MLGKARGVVVSVEELNVGREQVEAWLTLCLVPSCILLMPTTRSVSCPENVTAAQLLFPVGCKTLRKVVSCCLLYLKTITKNAAVGSWKLPVWIDEKVRGTFLRAYRILW